MVLDIEKFGKFENKKYELSNNLTLFFGENESGKTTIFDALMCNLTNDKKATSSFVKYIKNRYGTDIKATLNPPLKEELKMNATAYQNIYAIMQSRIILELDDLNKDSKDWQQAIKMKLFSSDIDITKLIASVKSEREGRAANCINVKIMDCQKEKKRLETEIDRLYKLSEEKNEKLSNIENSKKNIDSIIKSIKEKEEKVIKLKKEIEKIKKIKDRVNYTNLLSEIDKLNIIKEKIENFKYLENDETNNIKNIFSDIEELKKNLEYIKGGVEAKKNIVKIVKPTFDRESLKARIDLAIKKIDNIKNKKQDKISPELLRIISISSVSILSLVFVILAMLYKNIFFILLIVPLVPFLFIKIDKNKTSDDEIFNDIVLSLPEIKEEIANIKDNHVLRDKLLKELGKLDTANNINILNNDNEIKNSEDDIIHLETSIRESERELKNLLDKNRVSSLSEYIEQRERYASYKDNYSKLFEKLNTLAKRNSLATIELLTTEIKRTLEKLDSEHIHGEDINDKELYIRETEYNKLLEDIANLKDNLKNYTELKARGEGEISVYKDIHKNIVELESNLSAVVNEIKNTEDRKEALLILESMLERLNIKTDDIFDEMSRVSAKLYNQITGSNLVRSTRLAGFDSDRINVEDKLGEYRKIENLSTATRDIIYLSMRMAILDKIHEDGRIIILDDPFITFDNNRVSEALVFLKDYSLAKNIPIVIFTKDIFTKDFILGDDFKNISLVHVLS